MGKKASMTGRTRSGVEIRVTRAGEANRRSVEAELEIEAPVEAVWRALTVAAELENWFPPTARVEDGAGGSLELIWDDEVKTRMPIEIWEPGSRLQTVWTIRRQTDSGDEESVTATVDFRLEREGGRTRLRLVHSGFSAAEDWDDLFDGFRRGWAYELRSLKHYLEHHRGNRRGLAKVQRALDGDPRRAWERLFSAFFGSRDLASLREGESCTLQLPTGERLAGEVRLLLPPTDFAATVDTLERSLLRVKLGPMGDPNRPLVQVWLACWRLPDERVRAIEGDWQRALDAVFAG